jgi:hypothetical protein
VDGRAKASVSDAVLQTAMPGHDGTRLCVPDLRRRDRRTERGVAATRAVYEAELTQLVEVLVAGFRGAHASERAWSFLAVLSGAAAMARAVRDPQVRAEILAAARTAAKAI